MGPGLFSGAFAVSFRECKFSKNTFVLPALGLNNSMPESLVRKLVFCQEPEIPVEGDLVNILMI